MARSTTAELAELLESYTFPIELRDPKTGAVLAILQNMDSLLPFEALRPRFYVDDEGVFHDIETGTESVDEVRKALALVARAVRKGEVIAVENDYSYTIVASPEGSVQYGCQRYTAAEVKEAAAAIRTYQKSK